MVRRGECDVELRYRLEHHNAFFNVFVSDNDGPFTPFQTLTSDTAAIFTGEPGHIYTFFSVATDYVGHAEAAPAGADAETRITMIVWQNAINQLDVNFDTFVVPIDVLLVINELNNPRYSDPVTRRLPDNDGP